MKVEKLIEKLQSLPKDATVKLHDRFGSEVLFALGLQNDHSVVWLECEEDVDMVSELDARWQRVIDGEIDTVKFFEELEEIGIDESSTSFSDAQVPTQEALKFLRDNASAVDNKLSDVELWEKRKKLYYDFIRDVYKNKSKESITDCIPADIREYLIRILGDCEDTELLTKADESFKKSYPETYVYLDQPLFNRVVSFTESLMGL